MAPQIKTKLPVASFAIADACDKFGFAKAATLIREGCAPAVWTLRDAMDACSQRNTRRVAEAYHAYTAVCALHAVTRLATDTEIALEQGSYLDRDACEWVDSLAGACARLGREVERCRQPIWEECPQISDGPYDVVLERTGIKPLCQQPEPCYYRLRKSQPKKR